MTSARQIYLGSRRGPALPYDAEVEWLYSDGNGSYINTGIIPTSRDIVSVDFLFNTTRETHVGVVLSRSGDWMVIPNHTLYIKLKGADYSLDVWSFSSVTPPYKNVASGTNRAYVGKRTVVTVNMRDKYISMDVLGGVSRSVTISPGSAADDQPPMRLFETAPVYVYGMKVQRDGKFILDFIPVRFTNEQGVSEGATYDRVSGQLFRNSGTGVFGFGTDIAGGGYKWLGCSPLRFSRFWKEAA